MGGFRAKDADRERYVEVIEAAYVDGQLGAQDRELRVSRALTAETLDELHALTRDLQNQPAQVVVQAPAPRVVAPAPVPAAPKPVSTDSEGLPLKALGAAAAVIFAIVVMGLMSAAQDDMDFATEYEYAAPWEPDADGSSIGYQLSQRDMRIFVRRYEAKFGTADAYEVRFYANRVNVHVPVGGSEPRFDDWTWDGEWVRVAEAQELDGPADLADIGTLDLPALFENADVARQELGVSDAELHRVDVVPTPDGRGEVTLYVRNGSAHTAYMVTTLQGSRLRAVPYEG